MESTAPRATYSVLDRRITFTVVVVLLALAGAAWFLTVRQASGMSDMVAGLGQVGARMPNDTAIPVFMLMWIAMMVAMMFPTVMPMVLAHRVVVQKRGQGAAPTVAFVAGYILVWSLAGIVPLAAFLAFRHLSAGAADSVWLPALAGAILVVAGAYQFTRWKSVCLRACRSPMGFVLSHDFGGGSRSAVRAGVFHGAYCLGCCWALMAVLLVVGLMNLVWMVLLAVVFLAEKHWRHAAGMTQVVGSALVVLGLAVVVHPQFLQFLSGVSRHPGM